MLDLSGSSYLISTPNFQRLPCLERINLLGCCALTHIHPSISYHKTLIYVNMFGCTSLETFPPISGMKSLETLELSCCSRLCNFPEIQMNMDNLVELSLLGTGIKVVPSSIGQYCTNLVSLDLSLCESLESIEVNFHLLKHLKRLNLGVCRKLKLLEHGLFDLNYPVLDLCNTSFKDLPPAGLLGFSRFLRQLNLSALHLTDGDISSTLCELPNLQMLDLSYNDFSQFHCSLLQLRSLKVLDLSYCKNLVELPDLPEKIAVLIAYDCEKLRVVDLPTNLKWLWRISLPMMSISGDVDVGRKLQSMLQENAIKEDYSISLCFYDAPDMPIGDFARTRLLELPRNWYNEFSGFLICINGNSHMWFGACHVITIMDVMGRENEDVLEVSDGTPVRTIFSYLYISFGSLRHTAWWKSKHTTISFSLGKNPHFKVELVPRRSKSDSTERVKDTTSSSEFWDTEPIKIIGDSESCIEIEWDHHGDAHMQGLAGWDF